MELLKYSYKRIHERGTALFSPKNKIDNKYKNNNIGRGEKIKKVQLAISVTTTTKKNAKKLNTIYP